MLRSPMSRLIIGAVFFLALPYIYSQSNSKPLRSAQPQVAQKESFPTYIVTRVVDGDTLILSNGQKVRLTGIDTPESRSNDKALRDSQRSGEDVAAITQKGKAAAGFVRRMIEGKEVRLEFDVQRQDRYGRELAYVYDIETLKSHPELKNAQGMLVEGDDEIFLNGSIIRSGYATPLTVPPNVKYSNLFAKLYEEARLHQRGLWSQGGLSSEH